MLVHHRQLYSSIGSTSPVSLSSDSHRAANGRPAGHLRQIYLAINLAPSGEHSFVWNPRSTIGSPDPRLINRRRDESMIHRFHTDLRACGEEREGVDNICSLIIFPNSASKSLCIGRSLRRKVLRQSERHYVRKALCRKCVISAKCYVGKKALRHIHISIAVSWWFWRQFIIHLLT